MKKVEKYTRKTGFFTKNGVKRRKAVAPTTTFRPKFIQFVLIEVSRLLNPIKANKTTFMNLIISNIIKYF